MKTTISSFAEIPLALAQSKDQLLAIRAFLWGNSVTVKDEAIYQQVKLLAASIADIEKRYDD